MQQNTENAEPKLRERIVNGLAVLVLLSLGIVWPPLFAQVAEGAPDLDHIGAGSLLLKAGNDAAPLQALRQSTNISARITGNVARVHVTQKFENPGDTWVEGLYVFPLSAGAAVDELEMIVGERRIRGEIQRKAEARATYERARNEGRRASLVTQERPNMFTTSVANIAPHSSITIEIAYLDTVPFRDGRYTLNLPLSITPRYSPDMKGDLSPTLTAPTPERLTSAAQNAHIEVELSPGFPLGAVTSVNHVVAMSMLASGRRITLQAPTVPTDRDFELVWTPAVLPDMQAAAFAERAGDDTYVLVTLMPPQMSAERSYKREVLFIIDTSGSMSGPSIGQAREALRMGVDRLAPGDTFNIIRFSSDASSLFPAARPVGQWTRERATEFIDDLVADGGTEMRAALELAFAVPPAAAALRQIVFITDGSVSNEAELVTMIHQRLAGARLFTVGIGAAPNAYFMREAAAAGRGSYTFIPQIDQVRDRMEDLFHKLENPALVGLEIHWPGEATADLAASLPSDVYAGDPLVVAARLRRSPQGVLTVSGSSNGVPWTRQLPIKLAGNQSGIAKLWARERIGELSRQRNFGGDASAAQAAIVELALAHHLVSDFTSLIAVDVTPARPLGAAMNREQAGTSAPEGSYWARATGFASTATPAPLLMLVGMFALGLALLLRSARDMPGARVRRLSLRFRE
jgi:Ca-activated chloride channel homolog